MESTFEWDIEKDLMNQEKHDTSFMMLNMLLLIQTV